jgi:hypothetical protein
MIVRLRVRRMYCDRTAVFAFGVVQPPDGFQDDREIVADVRVGGMCLSSAFQDRFRLIHSAGPPKQPAQIAVKFSDGWVEGHCATNQFDCSRKIARCEGRCAPACQLAGLRPP